MFVARQITADPLDILWHYAIGYMPDFVNGKDGRAGWVRWSHRGVQLLENFELKQKRYVLAKEFELRIDHRFEQVVRACADTTRRNLQNYSADTWLTEDLIRGYIKLNELGYAHSYETWMNGELVGGTFGIHLGSFVGMASLFHRVSNASKAAVGRAMILMRDRGFKLVDIGMVPRHTVNFGSEWIPRWKYEAMLPGLISRKLDLADDRPAPSVPWQIRCGVPVVKTVRALRRRLPGHAA